MGCRQTPREAVRTTFQSIVIDSAHAASLEVETFVEPYRERIDAVLDSTLAYAPYDITKTDGPYNTTAGNLMADAMYEMATPIFEKRTGKALDAVLMNHGGIRAVISKGNVSARTAYEVMPFENSISVVALSGSALDKMVKHIVTSRRAHPISGLQIELKPNGSLKSYTINHQPVDPEGLYHVATSDYLVAGGDNMVFFREGSAFYDLNYSIRNALIDYFGKKDTLRPQIDQRYHKPK
ncbi:5'-nucleotidase C-terminal domain-containing protein [Maribacter sp. 2307ULW6-5]|uniref:5'-nucleotidase C-terminal domain-containing protein n=1 Tax=Maribacter sp. 2307ULW6-5 TaxID=3386275 RepID=UPI0039BCF93D